MLHYIGLSSRDTPFDVFIENQPAWLQPYSVRIFSFSAYDESTLLIPYPTYFNIV